jgi:modulator of FtsH protease HflK
MASNNNGPWGSGPNNPGPRPGGGRPTPNEIDLEEWLNKGREHLRRAFPGGGGGNGRGGSPLPGNFRIFRYALLGVLVLWLGSGFYQVAPNQQGVVLRFGKVARVVQPGLHYHLPAPVEMVLLPDVTTVNQMRIGQGDPRDEVEESRMLTGDENIVDLDFSVFWRVKDPVEYLFNVRQPDLTLKLVAESAMREVVGQMEIQPILTEKRSQIEADAADLIQKMLDDYKTGVTIMQVQLLNVSPPGPVVDAFNDVQRARADAERARNEAQAYANDILPRAKGAAQRMLEEAQGYKQQVVSLAKGEASRFESVLASYRAAPEVTGTRLYLETMEHVLSGSNKILLDPGAAKSGAVPYLALPEIGKKNAQEPQQ